MHWMLKAICGYLLHPKVPRGSTQGIRVTDVGAGSGIWLLELAEELPATSMLEGFDISSQQYPPPEWWANNVRLMEHDAFRPFPEQYIGAYDVVNVRFLLTLIRGPEAVPFLKNLVTLLKPGGYIQWTEPQFYSVQTKLSNPESASGNVVRHLEALMRKPPSGVTYEWVAELPSTFEKAGLELVCHELFPVKDSYKLPYCQGLLAALEETTVDSPNVSAESAQESSKFISELSKEFAKGVYLDTNFLCMVGRKPH
ncbi:S-adenosyl-L-methionine-dependent methyltransferase [Viridothelium virens]|uniref:S-adenosyl-L-methionine-dependent methyltransferase n=1 Tax=Viridothelium virens TaxID=1048519 RepID=A0A6A6HL33_VIRVR|nr:S-adenosyl-L-methionine-dependent methyltransferase [Viridothelium virens]